MNQLSSRDRELVALGAAMGSNCVPCIEHHVPEAAKAGLTTSEISEAIHLVDTVRHVPARKVLDAAHKAMTATAIVARADDNNTCAAAAPQTAIGAPCCG